MRYVITSGHPNLHGIIGDFQQYDRVGVSLTFNDERGFSSGCSFPLSDLRELDNTPIAAGDEVVCVDAQESNLTLGQVYVADRASVVGSSGYVTIAGKHFDLVRFVKVKPLSQPEVKQEATETESVDEQEPNFGYQTSPPPTKREPANSLRSVGREFWMVKGFGPAQYEHDSLGSAMSEAERLARAHPGVPFTVLGTISIFFNGVARIDRNFDDGMPF